MRVVIARVHFLPQPGRTADQLPAPPAQTISTSSADSNAYRHVVSSSGVISPGNRHSL